MSRVESYPPVDPFLPEFREPPKRSWEYLCQCSSVDIRECVECRVGLWRSLERESNTIDCDENSNTTYASTQIQLLESDLVGTRRFWSLELVGTTTIMIVHRRFGSSLGGGSGSTDKPPVSERAFNETVSSFPLESRPLCTLNMCASEPDRVPRRDDCHFVSSHDHTRGFIDNRVLSKKLSCRIESIVFQGTSMCEKLLLENSNIVRISPPILAERT